MARVPLVNVIVNTSTGYGRGVIRGIARYSHEHGPWQLCLGPIGFGVPEFHEMGRYDGVISRIVSQAMLRAAHKTRCPLVDVSDTYGKTPWPQITADPVAIAQAAVHHFLDLGFRNFAFCGFSEYDYSRDREEAYTRMLAASGFVVASYKPKRGTPRRIGQELARIATWIKTLEKPIGILACNDIRGVQLLYACLRHRISVPDEVSIIGVDNDEIICEACHAPLTSIDIGTEQIGYEAAATLDRLMRKKPVTVRRKKVGATRIIKRQSTRTIAFRDPIIRRALAYLQTANPMPATVTELMKDLPVSRRSFENRFLKEVGRSPYEELVRQRINQAQILLLSTDLTVDQIAERCGYTLGNRLSHAFRQNTGETPTEYRRRRHSPIQ